MVYRKKCGSLYAQYLDSIAGEDNCRFHPKENFFRNGPSNPRRRMFQENRSKNHQKCQSRSRNYFGETELRDFRHACTMCPGDFSHTSCKYCLDDVNDVYPENAKDDFTTYHRYNNVCSEPFYEEPQSAFANYRNYKRNFSANFDGGCEYCLKNGETAVICSSHQFRNPSGTIACPLLREYFGASSYDMDDGDYRRNGFDTYNCDAFLDAPLYHSNHYKFHRRKPSCRCSDEEMFSDYLQKCPLERTGAVPLVKRLSNGFLTREDYFDLLNLT